MPSFVKKKVKVIVKIYINFGNEYSSVWKLQKAYKHIHILVQSIILQSTAHYFHYIGCFTKTIKFWIKVISIEKLSLMWDWYCVQTLRYGTAKRIFLKK